MIDRLLRQTSITVSCASLFFSSFAVSPVSAQTVGNARLQTLNPQICISNGTPDVSSSFVRVNGAIMLSVQTIPATGQNVDSAGAFIDGIVGLPVQQFGYDYQGFCGFTQYFPADVPIMFVIGKDSTTAQVVGYTSCSAAQVTKTLSNGFTRIGFIPSNITWLGPTTGPVNYTALEIAMPTSATNSQQVIINNVQVNGRIVLKNLKVSPGCYTGRIFGG